MSKAERKGPDSILRCTESTQKGGGNNSSDDCGKAGYGGDLSSSKAAGNASSKNEKRLTKERH